MPTISHALIIVVPWWFLAVALAVLVLGYLHRRKLLPKNWEPVSAEINFAELGKVTIKPNREDVQIAYRAWVELATRKAGMPFDPENDVIVEVYDSWYELFGRLRELAKECPAVKIRTDGSTRQLVATLTQVMNRGMRPHLTRWQARFRRWYDAELSETDPTDAPQTVQRRYPGYDELVKDLAEVQEGLQRYMNLLEELSTGQ